jgi:hypothetical protein
LNEEEEGLYFLSRAHISIALRSAEDNRKHKIQKHTRKGDGYVIK